MNIIIIMNLSVLQFVAAALLHTLCIQFLLNPVHSFTYNQNGGISSPRRRRSDLFLESRTKNWKMDVVSSRRIHNNIIARGMTIVSPFDNTSSGEDLDVAAAADRASTTSSSSYSPLPTDEEPLDLTWENVDLVLEEMRPYLLQDGGNVAISEIDGPIVRLELQGACGTCPSSTQTMKMGLERKLKERIPEIQEVIQAMPDSPDLNEDQINIVLDSVRPFLNVAGGSIHVHSIAGAGGVQPTIILKMEGAAASLNSVKLEIAQRLQRHFMIAGLKVEWA